MGFVTDFIKVKTKLTPLVSKADVTASSAEIRFSISQISYYFLADPTNVTFRIDGSNFTMPRTDFFSATGLIDDLG